MSKLIHVAVGVVVGPDGKVLIAKRALNTHQGGLWEFPGGKVDAGEVVQQALVRELQEELAIEVRATEPLIQIRHHYPDKWVLLDVHKITQFVGEPRGNEGQPIQWVDAKDLDKFDFPAANQPIISAINLPSTYLITGNFEDTADFAGRLNRAVATGINFVQLRIANFALHKHQELLNIALASARASSANLTVNCALSEFDRIVEAHPELNVGLHLSSKNARKLYERPIEGQRLLGVSCHDADEIIHAQKIGADYLLLSPVLATTSHPGATPLGWNKFSALLELANVPVYALGGVGTAHVQLAQAHGAQGVAGISAWW
ncbi:MAG TPA: Nudix family hydrolase [Cellvibrio sp.]|nr:Nudix family hydrolase [Cellvibrio sp.]